EIELRPLRNLDALDLDILDREAMGGVDRRGQSEDLLDKGRDLVGLSPQLRLQLGTLGQKEKSVVDRIRRCLVATDDQLLGDVDDLLFAERTPLDGGGRERRQDVLLGLATTFGSHLAD